MYKMSKVGKAMYEWLSPFQIIFELFIDMHTADKVKG